MDGLEAVEAAGDAAGVAKGGGCAVVVVGMTIAAAATMNPNDTIMLRGFPQDPGLPSYFVLLALDLTLDEEERDLVAARFLAALKNVNT